ncbi:MAG: glycosyltransferase [Actinomycetales bacterium]
MTVKVSVVVPVYNPGERIEPLIRSLQTQSLPSAEYEVVFVDDGSTDGTGERLAEVVRDNPNMRLTSIPNSGWPGRPRNVGTDLAEGEYVFYSDNDDELYPEALERMYDLGAANGSDIVFSKVVRVGRPGEPPAPQTIGKGDLLGDGLLRSRTVHKLYRKAFLVEHDIRFLEGRVRLEDHHFMAQAMPRAGVVSVLADYPCYRWIHRDDGTNSSSSLAAMPTERYWGEFYAGAVRAFAETAGEGALLDEARLVAVEQAFARFSPARWAGWRDRDRRSVFDAVGAFLRSEAPPRLDHRLPVLKRLRVQALRAADFDLFSRVHSLTGDLKPEVEVEQVEWVDGALRLRVAARLVGRPDSSADPTVQAGPLGELFLSAGDDLGIPVEDRVLLPDDAGQVQLTVRDRASLVEWPVEATSVRFQESSADGRAALGIRFEATLDPETLVFGGPLDQGIWDVFARLHFLGEGSRPPIPAPEALAATVWVGAREVRAYATKSGNLALKVQPAPLPRSREGVRAVEVRLVDDAMTVVLPQPPANGGSHASVVLRRAGDEPVGPFPVEGRTVVLDLSALTAGQSADAYLRVESAAGVVDELLSWDAGPSRSTAPYAAFRGRHGGVVARRLRADEAPPQNAAVPGAGPRRGPAGLRHQGERVVRRLRRELRRRTGR